MPKGSGQANRNIGLDHQNGKGDKTRVTDVKAYRENFDEINWQRTTASKETIRMVQKLFGSAARRLKTLREIEEAEHDWRMGL